jgi:hypothetical protein
MSASPCSSWKPCRTGTMVAISALFPLEHVDRQWKPGRVGEQPDGDMDSSQRSL